MNDPLEIAIERALQAAGVRYYVDGDGPNKWGLDFYLPDLDVYIEVKRFHSERIAGQTARAPNVIVVQGEKSVMWLAACIAHTGRMIWPP